MPRRRPLALVLVVLCCIAAGPAGSARAATISVTGVGDTIAVDGIVTLREAVASINGGANVNADVAAVGAYGTNDEVDFAIAGSGVQTIALTGSLTFTKPAFLNGFSQPGSSPNTNALNAGINAVPLIEINGTGTSGALTVGAGAANTTIRGLVVNRSVDNVLVQATGVTIAGNFIGTNATGTAALPSAGGGFGIRSSNNVADNLTVGGPAAADRNLISGDTQGGVIAGTNTGLTIQGNYVGPDVTGTASLGAAGAVALQNMNNASILGNLISGNGNGGVFTDTPGNVLIQGNLIGTQRDATSPLGNGNSGVGVSNSTNVQIGGTGGGQGNVIAFNNVGVNVTQGTSSNGNPILGNSIHDSGTPNLGISLTSQASVPLANDGCDADVVFGNLGQNYPVVTAANIASGSVTVSGTLTSTASTTFRVEFFSNVACNVSGNGEGKTFLGFANVPTDASCNGAFGPLVFPIPAGETIITATATDPGGNTSEFSACVTAGGGGGATPTSTPTTTPTAPGPTSTPTIPGPTATPTVPVPTPTPNPNGPPATIPTLSLSVMLALAAALAAVAVLLLRRR
ncbi:MAG TPA: hypothetical protein VGH97_09605 [Thermoanaerobaculia bacterium]|jgi:hypothetical protein